MKTTALLACITLCALCHSAAAPAGNDPAARTSRWQEDLDFFARELPAKQKDFYVLMPKDRFEGSVAELKRDVPRLSDRDIVFELMRIVASLGVAHTSVAFGSATERFALHAYPVQMQWFSDGLAVVAATPEYREALGCRVVRIGSMTPKQVEAAVAPYIPHENTAKLRTESPRYMSLVELMQREEIADAAGHLQLTCARTNGKEFTVKIVPSSSARTRREWVTAADALHIPTEFCRKHPESFYWYEYLPDTHTLYIQCSKCADEPDNPFREFAKELFAFADSHPVQRVVVDLRLNAGGTAGIVKPLVEGLKSRPVLRAKGHLYTLIGGHTYSSAMFAAMDFHDLQATLIGEPTGNKPNHYGQQQSFVLPNSKLRVQYSVKHFQLVRDADPPTLEPDIVVPRSLNDFLAGHDPALDAALHHSLQ